MHSLNSLNETLSRSQFFDQNDTRSIKSLSNVSFSPELYAQINQRWPQFSAPPGRHGFNVKAEVGSQVLKDILQFLAEHGRTALWGGEKYPGPHEFRLSGTNVVEPADLERARYVDMSPAKEIANRGGYFLENGHLWVLADSIYRKVSMGYVEGGFHPVVDTPMRDRMIQQGFRDVRFNPVEIREESPRAKPLWLVYTDRVLPPHLPIMRHEDSLPYDPETGAPLPEHEFYKPYALRWRKKDIDAFGEFDFAFDTTMGGHRLYVSKRVYEWFNAQNLVESFFPLLEE